MSKTSMASVFTALVLCLGAIAGPPAMAQDSAAAKPGAKKAEAKAEAKKASGRLPMYFAQVVDQEQREKILAVQEEFEAKIRPLEAQIAALRKDRDAKVFAVLTPEQQKQLDDLKAAAKKNREDKKPAKTKSPGKPAAKATPAKKVELKAEESAEK